MSFRLPTHNTAAPAPAARPSGEGRAVQVYNLRYLPKWWPNQGSDGGGDARKRDVAGGLLLGGASLLLLALAAAQGYVSFRAQYTFIHEIKRENTASMLEALGLDAGAVIFALLALALARLGRPAIVERTLNLACVAGSLTMNAMSADFTSVKSIAVWTLPAVLYAAGSDRVIAVVRRRALARMPGAGRDVSPLAAALAATAAVMKGIGLWLLRLVLAPQSTLGGFRAWVVDEAPVAPGRRGVTAVLDISTFTGFRRWGLLDADNPAPEEGSSKHPRGGVLEQPRGGSSTRPEEGPRTAPRRAPRGGSSKDDKIPARGRPDAEVLADIAMLAEQYEDANGGRSLSLTALRGQMSIGDSRGRDLIERHYDRPGAADTATEN